MINICFCILKTNRPNRERVERERDRDWNRDRRYYDQYRDHYDDDHYYRENR